jgi:hypothetical protein
MQTVLSFFLFASKRTGDTVAFESYAAAATAFTMVN